MDRVAMTAAALRHNANLRLARAYLPKGALVEMVTLSSSALVEWDDVVKYHFEVKP